MYIFFLQRPRQGCTTLYMETPVAKAEMSPFQRKRLAVGLTQAQLADEIGVSRPTVTRWEGGVTPSAEFFPKLARIFRMSAEDVTHLFDPQPTSA